MSDQVDTEALRTRALRNQASNIRADATEAEQDWLEVAETLEAAADEVDRLRKVIETLNTTYDVDKMLRAIKKVDAP